MDDQGGEEELGFPSEDIERCLQESVEAVLITAQWDEKMVPQWINDICEKSMKALVDLGHPYKFVVTCMLM